MKKTTSLGKAAVSIVAVSLMVPFPLFAQCYFVLQNTERCAPSVAPLCSNTPPCYQHYSWPAYGTHCFYADEGAYPCGAVECEPTTVNYVLKWRTATCYQANEGPLAPQPDAYCYNHGTQFQDKPGGTCSKAVLSGDECGFYCSDS